MYEKLAEFYDTFMQDVPYEQWINYVARILGARKSGIDVGCGTGRFTVGLKKLGYDIVGADPSREMLSVATERAIAENVSIPFILQGANELSTSVGMDFITACCDVVNYLKKPEVFFKRAYSALKVGGVLTFDISTEYKLRQIIGDNVFTESTDEVTYVWENYPAAKSVDMVLTFFEKKPGGLYERTVDEQTQYVHTVSGITEALKNAGFSGIKSFGFLSDSRPKERAERVHFVAYKGTDVWEE